MLLLTTLLAISAGAPQAPGLVTLLETAGGADVNVRVVEVEPVRDTGCNLYGIARPTSIRVSGPTPFLLNGTDAKGHPCQVLVRATINATAQVQTLKRDVKVGEHIKPADFKPIWVSVEQAHGKLRHPISGKAKARMRKGVPVGGFAIEGPTKGPVKVKLSSRGLIISTMGERRQCRGRVNATTACVRLENGMRVTGELQDDGVVHVVLP